MNIVAAILCDFASVREGLLMVVAGGVTRVRREQLPAPLGIHLAVMLECTPDELRPHEFKVAVATEDGEEIARIEGGFAINKGPDLDPGEITVVPIALSLTQVGIVHYGRFAINIQIDENLHKMLSVRVTRPPSR